MVVGVVVTLGVASVSVVPCSPTTPRVVAVATAVVVVSEFAETVSSQR